uniref:ER membrane protein complex subunit 10 n=1 Tax=Oryza brachyantha TaxID=4533 RepID=J3N7D0_ORYBR
MAPRRPRPLLPLLLLLAAVLSLSLSLAAAAFQCIAAMRNPKEGCVFLNKTTLTKLRFTRNELTGDEKEAFKKLLNEDGFYSIRLLSNVLDPSRKDYVVSSIKARCIPRESLDEHIVIHMDGVNILAVNYGSVGGCQYPRPVKMPSKWIFNSYTVLKTSEQAPRTPSFVDQLLEAENGLGEVVKPPEKSFWAKYWMYIIPLGLIVMNAVTAAANMPEEQAGGQGQPGAQRAPNAAPRRR